MSERAELGRVYGWPRERADIMHGKVGNISVRYACCQVFDGWASMIRPGFGHGAIGWVTDQGDPHWATEQFILTYCPFCGSKLRDPNGDPL